MKKLIIAGAIVGVVGIGAFAAVRFGGSGDASGSAAVAMAAEEQQAQQTRDGVTVDARVVPAQSAELSLPMSGIAAEVLVAEGETVEAGQLIVRLKATQQVAAVAQAEAQVARAEARLAELQAGAREQEVATAQAALDGAKARLSRVQNGALPEEVTAARAALSEAQASLQKVLEGASDQQTIAAEADLANAEAIRRQAQAAYDRVAGNADIGARPEAAQLEQATNAVNAAQARLADLQRGASAADIAAARARVQRAQAQLDLLAATNPADVAEAESAVRQAQAQLDLVEAGVRDETIAVAEADVQAAEAALTQAQAALAEMELRAPFAGTVASLNAAVGEQITAGAPVVVLGDLTRWQIETEDLTEFDAVNVKPGDVVTIAFDALPDLQKDGVVKLVRPIGENNRGDIVYTLVIEPSEHDARLLWNMTAVVTLAK
ncbi:MAG: efflux RND transporter periplasmic adaptor subunit [Anaerolineales bacterium]|nr:efflux RND transporter periplasmic adaptor subunit [Anaerolineales bacterium]